MNATTEFKLLEILDKIINRRGKSFTDGLSSSDDIFLIDDCQNIILLLGNGTSFDALRNWTRWIKSNRTYHSF